MKQINFVPPSVRQKAAQQLILPFLGLAGIVALAAVGAAWFGVGIVRSNLNEQLSTLQQIENEKVAAANKEQQDLNVDADLTNRVSQINTLTKSDVDWQRTFTYIGSVLPQDIVLTSYTIAGATTGSVTMKMVGEAPSNVSFATFIQALQENKELKGYSVDGYSYTPGKGTVAFTMTLNLPQDKLVYVK